MPRWAIGLGALAALALLAKRVERVTVAGDSMRPTLEAGDRLLVWRTRGLRPGWLVVVPDPRVPDRPLVKRGAAVTADGTVAVRGDNPSASTDSRAFGVVPRARIDGRVVYRYHPPARAGVLR
jgi:nickel-type superoxide dismutase maturation protease